MKWKKRELKTITGMKKGRKMEIADKKNIKLDILNVCDIIISIIADKEVILYE